MMGMKTLLIFSVLLLSGCAHQMFNGSLANGDFSVFPKEKIQKEEPPPEVCKGKCGYVTTRTMGELDEYFSDCRKKKVKPQVCSTSFKEMLVARLTLAYPSADYAKISLWCKAEPKLCDLFTVEGGNAIEDQIIASQEEVIASQKYAKSEKDYAERKAALRAWALSQQRTQTNCTQTRMGSTVFTNCQ